MAILDKYITLWVCVNCIMHHANGECGDCHNSDGHEGGEPLNRVDYRNSTAGMPSSEHDEQCLRFLMGSDAPGDYECDCERITFSTSTCQGCGSEFHGERHAMTEWSK
jgi:hypothetical protein